MRARGFSYIGLLILLSMMAAALAGAGSLWSVQSRRDREAELLFVGDQFRAAIAQYREQTPSGQSPRFPTRLEELLDDRRWPVARRPLRRLYVDPMTGTREWGVIRSPDGAVLGVFSLSTERPLKRRGFGERYEDLFRNAASYRDWRFDYTAGPPDDGSPTN